MANITRMAGRPERELDTTPIEMPLGACRPTPLQDIVARMVREAVAAETAEEPESWEESNDFEEEDPETLDLSPYELQEVPDEAVDPTHNPEYNQKDFKLSEAAEASEAPQEQPATASHEVPGSGRQPGDQPNPDAVESG